MLAVLGCHSEPEAASHASCPPAPSACTEAPSYKQTVASIFETSCVPCHSPNGVEADRPLGTYHDVFAVEPTAFHQVANCLMPPADAGSVASLSETDRETLLAWFTCGAPNN
jgi:hypothetical protein